MRRTHVKALLFLYYYISEIKNGVPGSLVPNSYIMFSTRKFRCFISHVKGTVPPWKKVVKYTRIACQNVENVLLDMFVIF